MPDLKSPLDDQPWPQADFYDQSPLWSPSGVVGPPQTAVGAGEFPLTLNGLDWSVGLGRAMCRGQRYRRTETAATGASVPNTHTSQSRRDRLVIRRDLAAKTTAVTLLQGTPAANPLNPALTQVENGVWETPLFSWLVGPNSSTVLTDVVDERAFLAPDGSGLPTFPSLRARDAHFNAPVVGQRCRVATGGRLQTWEYRTVNGAPAWTWPMESQGQLARRDYSGRLVVSNSAAQLGAFDLTVPVIAPGRRIRLTFTGSLSFDQADCAYGFLLRFDGGTNRRRGLVSTRLINVAQHFTITVTFDTTAALTDVVGTVTGARFAGAGNATLIGDDLENSVQYLVEDLGAA